MNIPLSPQTYTEKEEM